MKDPLVLRDLDLGPEHDDGTRQPDHRFSRFICRQSRVIARGGLNEVHACAGEADDRHIQ
jgi:hypothetical protein